MPKFVDSGSHCRRCPQDNNLGDDVSDTALARNIDLNRYIFSGVEHDNDSAMISGYWVEIMCICLFVVLCLTILYVLYHVCYGKKNNSKAKVVDYVENGGYTSSDDNLPSEVRH